MSINKTAPRTGLPAEVLSAAVPSWAGLRETTERLKREVIERQAEQPAPLDVNRSRTEAILNAKPAELQKALDGIRADAAAREAVTADLDAIVKAREVAESRLAVAEQHATEDVVEGIRARVEKVASTVYGLRHRPLNADEAIAQDAVADYKRLQELAQEWTELVRAYATLTRGAVEGPGISALAPAAFIEDPLHFHPHFQRRRADAGRGHSPSRPDGFEAAMIAWSEAAPAPRFDVNEPRGNAVPMGAEPVAWVAYLAEHRQFAVHHPEDALELWGAAKDATEPISRHSAESRAVARTRYAKALGDDDLTTVQDIRPLVESGRRRAPRGAYTG